MNDIEIPGNYLISTSIGIASRRHSAAAATPSRHGVDSPFSANLEVTTVVS
jgi:hypothetical protein